MNNTEAQNLLRKRFLEYLPLHSEDEKSLFWQKIRQAETSFSDDDKSIMTNAVRDGLLAIKARLKEIKEKINKNEPITH
jgi:hypothetical protein